MNITGIIGFLMAMGFIIGGIVSNGPLGDFVDIASLLIVFGGTIGVVVYNFPFSVLKKVPKMLRIAIFPVKYDPEQYIEEMVEHCKTARMKGILALEETANACENPFMKSALMLIVDANDSDKVKSMLDDSIDFMCERHESNFALWSKAAGVAPAIGMVGTLIGLIQMLAAMDPTNPESANQLGPAMSVALITTFYGCIIAHVMATPVGTLCKYNHNKELLCLQIIEEGTLAIISGANPRYVEEKLRMMLPATYKESKKSARKASSEE
ncbi:MAG: MotA/TolQ/ExbB proton channel family protein [Oscillospiraceae bacterium]|nr:MotA/TolQ/ExbB proton channel family protein [Oscillospiraceae bacterium]